MSTVEQRRLPRVAFRGRERRPIEDRLAARFPRLARQVTASLTPWVLHMPRRSRVRQELVEWSIWRGIAARKRGDLEVLRTMWHPDCIFDFTRAEAWVGSRVYRGHEGLAALVAEWGEAWREGGWVDAVSPDDVSLEEFGRGVFLFDMTGRGVGRVSGAAVVMEMPHIIELRDGLPWLFEHFTNSAEALEAAQARGSRAT